MDDWAYDDDANADDEMYFDFGPTNNIFGDIVFDFTGKLADAFGNDEIDIATADVINDADTTVNPEVKPKLCMLRYGFGRASLKRFVSNPNQKPSCVSKDILDGLDDLEDLYSK